MDGERIPSIPLRRLALVIDIFRGLDPEIQGQQIATFLAVAVKDGEITIKGAADATDQSSASISRNVAAISQRHRLGKMGLDLVIAREDFQDRRQRILSLTPKGRKVARTIAGILLEQS